MMNKRRFIKKRFQGHRLFAKWMICLGLLFGTIHSAQGGALDLLQMPAENSDRATISILMDVKKVDDRLIAVGEWGRILYSGKTCGESWIQAEVPVSVTLTAVCFPTIENGWAVGHDGAVLYTQDRGETWEIQLDGNKINKLVYDQLVKLIADKENLLENEKETLSPEETEKIEEDIENLGFFLSDAEMALNEGPSRPLMDVWFKNNQEGIVVGVFGMILKTTDGGKSWIPILDRIENPNGYHYYGITRSGDNLFIVGEMGLLYKSSDFGQTWGLLTPPYEGSFFGVVGNPGGDFIIAFGLRGNVCYSTDGGETWQHKSVGRSSINGGTWLSEDALCLVAVDGSIYISPDKGKTFKALSTKFPAVIAVAQSANDELTVVGLNGVKKIDMEK